MIERTIEINTPVVLTVLNPAGTTGQSVPADLTLLKDGAIVTTPTVAMTDVNLHGLYNFSFTPQATGNYVLFAYGAVQASIDVVSTSVYTYLKNIEDEAIGSWQWNKTDGTLTMLRQDGSTLASFAVVDTMTEASRERTT